jgi:hypothetical protein
MTGNLKVLGLALLALFALGAVAASSASAVPFFHSDKEKTVLTAEGTGATFGTKSSIISVTCKKEIFSGTTNEKTVTSVTVHPTYKECKAEPFGNATVTTTGCNYILYAETTQHPKTPELGGEETDSPVELECEAGKAITIAAPGCTITITTKAGEKLHGVIYDNENNLETEKRDVKVTVTVDKIKYKSAGFGCGLGGIKAEGEDGFLTNKTGTTTKGFVDNCAVGECPFGAPDKDEYKEGLQTGIWWE